MAKKKARSRPSLLDAIKDFFSGVAETAKTYTVSGRKKRASSTPRKAAKGGKQRLRPPTGLRKRAKATPFLKTFKAGVVQRLVKRGVRPLGPRQRKTYLALKRKLGAGKRLTREEKKTWDRLSKQVLENRIISASVSSANKQSSRRAQSNSKGRRNRVITSKKAKVAKGRRKGRNSKK